MENSITTFEANKIYQMRFIGDSDLKVNYLCVGRTAKRATFQKVGSTSEVIKRGVKVHGGTEYVLEGSYSMSPCIKASRIVG